MPGACDNPEYSESQDEYEEDDILEELGADNMKADSQTRRAFQMRVCYPGNDLGQGEPYYDLKRGGYRI
jgi:hypothetical protein